MEDICLEEERKIAKESKENGCDLPERTNEEG